MIASGFRSGKLVAVRPTTANEKEWVCVCDCGGEKVVLACALRGQEVKSCGCIPGRRRHNGKGTRTYLIWKHMRGRCGNPKNKAWKNYGGRGIRVCQKWEIFDNFLRDMGDAPPGQTIERDDVNGDYTPQNCKWANRTTQARNKRSNFLVEFRGEIKTLAEWAEMSPVSQQLVRTRYVRYGWSFEKALLTPTMFTPTKKPRSP